MKERSRRSVRSLRPGVLGRRVKIPLFEVVSNPQIPMSQIKRRMFSIMDRYEEKDKISIKKEDIYKSED